MRYKTAATKGKIFKIIYLVFSVLVAAYTAYLLIANLVSGIKTGISFDETIILLAVLLALLFEGSIAGFVIRSFNAPTLLMKNLVFKNDGTPYWAGFIGITVAAVVFLALAVVVFVSAYVVNFIGMDKQSLCFMLSFLLIVGVNFAFTTIYFLTFRHEAGSFAII